MPRCARTWESFVRDGIERPAVINENLPPLVLLAWSPNLRRALPGYLPCAPDSAGCRRRSERPAARVRTRLSRSRECLSWGSRLPRTQRPTVTKSKPPGTAPSSAPLSPLPRVYKHIRALRTAAEETPRTGIPPCGNTPALLPRAIPCARYGRPAHACCTPPSPRAGVRPRG